jgi:hypothetical protein
LMKNGNGLKRAGNFVFLQTWILMGQGRNGCGSGIPGPHEASHDKTVCEDEYG